MPEPAASRGPYRSKTTRAARPRQFHIEERDVAILAAVHDHRFLIRELLLLLFPPDPTRTPKKAIAAALAKRGATFTGQHVGSNLDRRLRELFQQGLLDRISRGLGQPFAYALTRDGQRLLLKEGRVTRTTELAKPSERLFYVEHALMVARLRIAIALAVRGRPSLAILTSQREGRDLRRSWRERGQRFSVNPDGFVLLVDRAIPDGRNARAFFLECDRGTMTLERLLLKYEMYARFEHSGELKRQFGVSIARIATVACTGARASSLLNLVADAPRDRLGEFRDRFLFSTEEAYREHPTNVLAQIWRSADKPSERNAWLPSPLPLCS
jgi:hypothetical protein